MIKGLAEIIRSLPDDVVVLVSSWELSDEESIDITQRIFNMVNDRMFIFLSPLMNVENFPEDQKPKTFLDTLPSEEYQEASKMVMYKKEDVINALHRYEVEVGKMDNFFSFTTMMYNVLFGEEDYYKYPNCFVKTLQVSNPISLN